jgi:hypothetical protein
MIDGQFYLVPYGADNGTSARLKATAISAGDFQSEIAKLAQHGRSWFCSMPAAQLAWFKEVASG